MTKRGITQNEGVWSFWSCWKMPFQYYKKLGSNCQKTIIPSQWGKFLIWFQIWNIMFLLNYPYQEIYFFSKTFPHNSFSNHRSSYGSFISTCDSCILNLSYDKKINHMVVIQVHVVKNLVDDVLLVGKSIMNIIIKDLRKKLGLPIPRLLFYTLRMANQTLTKLIGLISNPYLWNSIHCTFTMMNKILY